MSNITTEELEKALETLAEVFGSSVKELLDDKFKKGREPKVEPANDKFKEAVGLKK